ncbi:SusC/RagA family TonB-linked outer membrane protein [Pedobacter panaciterrae]|uniref:SusC/RagA family TonB-linked outer membrane protein n=1 Tax=Pedobacter panaciterrae TaxID=363849 RepID=UPI00155DA710|nr:SusC/RagA family TonB-linked outer membrane protein [Pedobacter panaciterrae]NQX54433.1 SusC/RagA family TonB-linked outer membrane protein [Pedobacter panaciterrae]
MRLTTVILIASLMQVSAVTFGQRITMTQKNIPLKTVLRELTKQSGYGFFYDGKAIGDDQKVTVALSNVEFDEALKSVLTGLRLSYKIDGKIVSIRKIKQPSLLDNLIARFQAIDVSGRVVDADGRGLPGASVSVKGKGGKAVSTGANGSFYLKSVDEDATLIVSFIGYVTKEIKAAKELGDVVLELSTSKLDEVQVIAYGTTTQRLSTGNVTTIKADVIEKQPVNNPLLALQGRVPGLFIEQATGFAGTGVKVRIQGTNSMANGNDPLYVIDGIPMSSQLLPGANGILGGEYANINGELFFQPGNPLSFINPSDIESIDILKDADATAIYGSRAANGAILITTKKGKAGKVKVNANVQSGRGNVNRRLDLMNTQEYLEMRREALKNDGITTLKANDYDLNGAWDDTRNVDWQKELIGGTANYSDLQASVSGGSVNTQFLVGAGLHKEGNVFPGDFDDTKTSVHFNVNSASTNQKFKAQFSGFYLVDDNLLPQRDLTSSAMTLSPVAPSLYTSTGSINWQPNSVGTTFTRNPMGYLYSKSKNRTSNLIGNALLSFEVIDGLEVKSSFGYNNLQANIINTSPPTYPESVLAGFRNTIFGANSMTFYSLEPQVNYSLGIGNGKLEVLIGSTIQNEDKSYSSISGSGFSTDQVMEDIKSATTLTALSSINSTYKYNALFGRINYNWRDKYILNLTARRDGSSRFGSENKFHNFGAVGAAWIFSEEDAIKDHLKFLSFGKLRASIGTTGSDQISNYQYLNLYDAISVNAPYQGVNGYQPNGLTNPHLQWEETKKFQVGLDLGFFRNNVLINVNYFKNRSSNQLLGYQLPITTGFRGISANLPATIQNLGWEFTLSSTNISSASFKWSSSINLTLPKNKLVSFKDFENSPYTNIYAIGQPINRKAVYHFLGVDPTNGLYQFADISGNPTISPVDGIDNTARLNTDPKFYGGFQNSFTYKGFQLDFLFQFVKQIGENYFFGRQISPYAGVFSNGVGNMPRTLLNRWQATGDDASSQKYSSNGSLLFNSQVSILASDASWSDASYIRLKNLSLSYQLPLNWMRKIYLQSCRLYVQGQNLLTFTNYIGLDPETKSSLSLPPLRVITLGLQVGI